MEPHGKELTTEQKEIIVICQMKVFRAIKYRIWQASTGEQSRHFWSGWEKEETLKTCHEVGVDEKRLLGMTGFFFVAWKQKDDKLWKM